MDKKALFHKFVMFTTAVHQVSHDMTKDVKPENITPVQYSILEYIAVSQPVTLSQISDCQRMSMPNTSRELKKLTDKQLCEKVSAADDRRKQYIRLSKQGQTLMDEAFTRIEARFLQHLSDTSDDELAEIEHALDVLQAKVFFTPY